MKNREPRTDVEMERYIDKVSEVDEPCEEGHWGCACWEGGPCANRVEAQLRAIYAERGESYPSASGD